MVPAGGKQLTQKALARKLLLVEALGNLLGGKPVAIGWKVAIGIREVEKAGAEQAVLDVLDLGVEVFRDTGLVRDSRLETILRTAG